MRKQFRIIFLFIFLFFLNQAAYSQLLPIKTFNVQNGLAQSQVQAIVQDSLGYLWFGTADGLSRFDGLHFKNFTMYNGLSGNDVTAAFQDGDSLIWFGMNHNGITLYHQKSRTFTEFSLNDSLSSFNILSLFRGKNGTLWIGTGEYGLIRYDGKKLERLTQKQGLPNLTVNCIKQDAYSNLWIGTNRGIVIFNPKNYANSASFNSLTEKNGLPAKVVYNILFDTVGTVWIGTRNHGLVRGIPNIKKKMAFTFHSFTTKNGLPDNWIRSMFMDKKGHLWIGTLKGAVNVSKIHSQHPHFYVITTANGLGHNRVDAILEDREGDIWFGTWGGGISQFKGKYFETYTMADGLPDNTVWSIYEDKKHTFWLGTEKGLVGFRLNKESGKLERRFIFTKRNRLLTNFILCIKGDGGNGMWLGTWGTGLIHFNPYSKKVEHYVTKDGLPSNYIVSLKKDGQNYLWIATLDNGISHFNLASHSFKNFNRENGFPSNLLTGIYEDYQHHFWFTTKDEGVIYFDGKKFTALRGHSSQLPCGVNTMEEDNEHNFWFGTISNGILVINKRRGVINHFTLANGLGGDNVFSLLFDDHHHVWIGNKSGLDCYNLKDSTFKHYGINDGFLGLEPNQNAVLKDSQGHLWFGTIGGAVRYLPECERTNAIPPKIIIDKISLFFKEKPPPSQHKFAHNKNHITFYFTGISFLNPEQIKYSFKLSGFDKRWSPLSHLNYVTYSNLPPGKYAFKVKAQNANGIWSKKPARFSFEILPPFWDHWYFFLGIVILFVILIYWIIYLRTSNIKKYNIMLEERVKSRTAELEENAKNLAKAYESLKESEIKFRTLTESTSSAVFIYQGDKFIFANKATCFLTGYSSDEFLRIHFWDVVHPDFKELIKTRGLARQRGVKVPNHYEFKIIRKDGEARWIDFSSSRIMFEGKPAGLGTAYDITDRKNAEEALKESELQLRTLINAMPDIVCFKDSEGRWIEANDFDLRLFQIEGVSYQGKKDSELAQYSRFYEKAFLTCEVSDKKAWEKGAISRGEEVIPRPDGNDKIFDIIKVPIFNDDGSRKGLVVIGRDITEKKKAEEALRAEKERLGAILRSIHEGVIATDKDFNLLFLNQFAEELLYPKGKKISNKLTLESIELYTQKKQKFDFQIIKDLIQQGKSFHSTHPFILQTENGKQLSIEFDCSPIKGFGRKITGSVITFRDVSEKQKLEQELFKARKLESLAILAGGLAHDFNNILTAIIGNLSLTKMMMKKNKIECSPKLRQLLENAEKASMRAQGLTQQLLTFSKGGSPIKKASDIQELILSTVEFTLRGSKVRCNVDLPDDLWPVEIDEGQMSQVVNNLTINALQAMPNGGYFYVKGENVHLKENNVLPLPAGKYVKIYFKDTGSGISPEHLNRIFDPYFTTKVKGSGLGLASTYSIIKKHGGHITVQSVPSKGTTFIFYLPASDKKLLEKDKEIEIQTKTIRNARILVMDDEIEIRKLVKEILQNMGFEVLGCAEGYEAIELYKKEMKNEHPIDLVILDLTVPGGLGGKEALQELQKIDPNVKAIVSSGYSTDPIMAEYSKHGFLGVVNKPYQAKELIITVQSVLSNNL